MIEAGANMSKNILRKIPAIVIMVGICYLSSLPGNDPLLRTFQFNDKIKHFIAYFTLGISFCLWIPNKKWLEKPAVWGALIVFICTIFGICDEFHQSFVPGRSGNDLGDIAADFGGGLFSPFAYILALKLVSYWHRDGDR